MDTTSFVILSSVRKPQIKLDISFIYPLSDKCFKSISVANRPFYSRDDESLEITSLVPLSKEYLTLSNRLSTKFEMTLQLKTVTLTVIWVTILEKL